jgi:RNA polymerase sigma factor (sigma-70 family)
LDFRTFAQHSARGAVRDYFRKSDVLSRRHRRKVKDGAEEAPLHTQLPAGLTSSEPGPAELTEQHEVVGWLRFLTPRQQSVIVQHFWLERTAPEIAQSLGIHLTRVYQIRDHAIQRIRKNLRLRA